MRFQVIKELEGRYAPAPSGQFFLVRDEKFHTEAGSFPLLAYGAGALEIMLRDSISQEEYQLKVAVFNQARLDMLHVQPGPAITFASPISQDEQDAQLFLKMQSPRVAAEALGDIWPLYKKWYNDQQMALVRAAG